MPFPGAALTVSEREKKSKKRFQDGIVFLTFIDYFKIIDIYRCFLPQTSRFPFFLADFKGIADYGYGSCGTGVSVDSKSGS